MDPSLALYFHLTPLPRPYTVEWTGKLRAPVTGTYAFGLESIDDSWLYLDGGRRPVVEAHTPNQYAEARINLTAGLHDIRVRFLDKSGYSHINLFWTPPGGSREIVPSERLFPPQGAYPAPTPGAPPPGGRRQRRSRRAHRRPGRPASRWSSRRPGVAAATRPASSASRGTSPWTARGRSTWWTPATAACRSSAGMARPWRCWPPSSRSRWPLVVDSRDNVIVLDSATGWIYRFDAAGAPLGRLGGPAAQLYHPRGMAIDGDGNLYVADTGGCRIVKFSPDGAVLARFGSKGSGRGQFLEPTDVVVESRRPDVRGRHRQQADRAAGRGRRLPGRMGLPAGSALQRAVHLALASGGRLLATDPEGGKLVTFDSGGRQLQETGRKGSADGEFRLPVGLVVDREGRVYVADTGNGRVQVLAPAD